MSEKQSLLSAGQFLEELADALELTPVQIVSSSINGSLSAAIAKRRCELGMTQSDLAKRMGKSQPTVSKWENGEVDFTVELLTAIADALDMMPEVRLKAAEEDFSIQEGDDKIIYLNSEQWAYSSSSDAPAYRDLIEM